MARIVRLPVCRTMVEMPPTLRITSSRAVLVSIVAVVATLASLLGTGVALAPPASADPGARIVSGWMPYWRTSPANPQGITSAVAAADLISDISPFWYSAVKGGPNGVTVRFNPGFTNAAANAAWSMEQLRAAGLTVLPAIADGSGRGTMAAVLADPAKRAGHIADLVALVDSGPYDGLDLDYEVFAFSDGRASWDATRPNWVAFVTELANALHSRGKLLSVTIPPPCNTRGDCGGTNGYFVYDIAAIGAVADIVRIMTYDFSVSRSGPIAPLSWVRTIMAYSASVVPPSKLQVGIPTYGRVWTKRTVKGGYELRGDCPTSGSVYTSLTRTTSITAVDMPRQLQAAGADLAQVQYDPTTAESVIEFDRNTTWTDGSGAQRVCTARRVAHWVGPDGAMARLQLVGELGLRGGAFWTISGEDPSTWVAARAYSQQFAPAPTEVAVTAPATATFNTPTTIAATAVSQGAPVAGVPATLAFKARGRKQQWTPIASSATAADGTVAFTVQPTTPGSWQVIIAASAGRAEQASAPASIAIASSVKAAARSKAGRVIVRVVAQPATRGQQVIVQVQRGDRWRTVGKARVDARGVARIRIPGKQGTYRAVAAPVGRIAAAASEPFTLG